MPAAKVALQQRRPEPPAPPSAERLRLAERIAVRDESRRAIAAAATAYAAGEEAVSRARSEHEAALRDVEMAKTDAGTHAVATAAGKAGQPPRTIQEARAAEINAAATLAAARDTKVALEAEVVKAGSIDWQQTLVSRAAANVLATSDPVASLVVEVERLQVLLSDKGAELYWLLRSHALPVRDDQLGSVKTHQQVVAERYQIPPASWDLPKGAGGIARWQETLDRLMIDATAEILT